MKKNAFTLIEILAAIVIMGILSTIIVTASIRKVNQARENSYKTLINSIELSAKNYVVDNENNLDDFLNNDWINISLQTLVDNKYLNNIKNPKTNKDLPLTDIVYVTRNYDGKIEATYDIEQDNKNKLTLSGAYNIYIKENSTYNDPGILLNDNLLNSGVTITGEVNTSIVKKYQITYQYNGKTLKRNIEDDKTDISVLGSVYPFEMFGPKEKKVLNTIEKINLTLRTYTGGYLRFEQDSYRGGKNPWPISTLWMAMYYQKAGDNKKAKECIEFVVKSCNKHGLLGEQVDNGSLEPNWVIGLGWSHAMFILALGK